jgi:hypothetical protein
MHLALCVGFVQVRVNDWGLSLLPSPILELQHAPLPLYSAASQGVCPDSLCEPSIVIQQIVKL